MNEMELTSDNRGPEVESQSPNEGRTLTNYEIEQYIHEQILGKCWHEREVDPKGTGGFKVKMRCVKCGDSRYRSYCGNDNPDYCSSLDVVLPVWELFGFVVQPSGLGVNGRTAWWRAGYTAFADRPDESLMSPENPSVIGGESLPQTIARACVKAHRQQTSQPDSITPSQSTNSPTAGLTDGLKGGDAQ